MNIGIFQCMKMASYEDFLSRHAQCSLSRPRNVARPSITAGIMFQLYGKLCKNKT